VWFVDNQGACHPSIRPGHRRESGPGLRRHVSASSALHAPRLAGCRAPRPASTSSTPDTGKLRAVARHRAPTRPNNRLNDGFVDADGFLWFGSMDDDEEEPRRRASTRLTDGGSQRREPGFTLVTKWPGGQSRRTRSVPHRYARRPSSTHLIATARRNTVEQNACSRVFGHGEGHPGRNPPSILKVCVWTGVFGGWGLRRYSPQGELLTTLRPALLRLVTKAAFAGGRPADALQSPPGACRASMRNSASSNRWRAGCSACAVDVPGPAAGNRVAWHLTKTRGPFSPLFARANWFDDPKHPRHWWRLYLETLHETTGLTANETAVGKTHHWPIAQNRRRSHALPTALPSRDGQARARRHPGMPAVVPMEFPFASDFRELPPAPRQRSIANLAYLGLVEILHGYPIERGGSHHRLRQDHAGADHGRGRRSTIPAIVVVGRPRCSMVGNDGDLVGSGTVIWRFRVASSRPDKSPRKQFPRCKAAASAPLSWPLQHHGHGFSTMNAVAEVLGLSLPGMRGHPRALIASADRSPMKRAGESSSSRTKICGRRRSSRASRFLNAHHDNRGDRRLDETPSRNLGRDGAPRRPSRSGPARLDGIWSRHSAAREHAARRAGTSASASIAAGGVPAVLSETAARRAKLDGQGAQP